jgi:hypothetical protein
MASPPAVSPAANERRYSRPSLLARSWRGWVATAVVLGLLVVGGVVFLRPVHEQLQPAALSSRLTALTGQPASVAASSYQLLPSPQVTASDIRLANGLTLKEAVIRIDAAEVLDELRGGAAPRWATLVVPELSITPEQGLQLMELLHRMAASLPSSIGRIQVSELRLQNSIWPQQRFQALALRERAGLGSIELKSLGGEGSMTLSLRRSVGPTGQRAAAFDLTAEGWQPPVGPAVRWAKSSARGFFQDGLIVLENFDLGDFGGSVVGAAVAARDVEWAVALQAKGAQLHLPTLLETRLPNSADRRALLGGIANIVLQADGRGASLTEALATTRARGTVDVDRAELYGVNLGLAAVQGTDAGTSSKGGGITRFRQLSSDLDVTEGRIALPNIQGRAGAMSVLGQVDVASDQALSGRLRVELGGARVQAPLALGVGGTLAAPEFRN